MQSKFVVILLLAMLLPVNKNVSAQNRTDQTWLTSSCKIPSGSSTYIPLLGVKTNLLYWSGFTPEMKWKQVLPNLSLEVFLGKRWSLTFDGSYTSHLRNGDDLKKYAFSSFGSEFRIWLTDDYRFQGFYGGIYGDGGQFDVTPKTPEGKGHTGSYIGTGLTVGYAWMFTPWLGVEVGVRGGFRHVSYDDYTQENSRFYYQQTRYKNSICLNGVFLNLTARLGKYKK